MAEAADESYASDSTPMENFGSVAGQHANQANLTTIGNRLARYSSSMTERAQDFMRHYPHVLNDDLVIRCYACLDKVSVILNQLVVTCGVRPPLSVSEHRALQPDIGDLFLMHLAVFLALVNLEVSVCCSLIFLAFKHKFDESQEELSHLGVVAINVGDCMRYHLNRLPKIENMLSLTSEVMVLLDGHARGQEQNVDMCFLRLEEYIRLNKMYANECESKIAESFERVGIALTNQRKMQYTVVIGCVAGAVVGFAISAGCTINRTTAVVTVFVILFVTSSCIAIGALIGYYYRNKTKPALLSELLKCVNEREHFKREFFQFRQTLVRSDEYLNRYQQPGSAINATIAAPEMVAACVVELQSQTDLFKESSA